LAQKYLDGENRKYRKRIGDNTKVDITDTDFGNVNWTNWFRM